MKIRDLAGVMAALLVAGCTVIAGLTDLPPEGGVDGSADAPTDSAADHGCTIAGDCPPGKACDRATGTCSTSCDDDGTSACNGGCCNSGECAAGTASNYCGNDGKACLHCMALCDPGGACVAVSGGGVCGCNSSNDCLMNCTGSGRPSCDRSGTSTGECVP